jgi:hypothetical protein
MKIPPQKPSNKLDPIENKKSIDFSSSSTFENENSSELENRKYLKLSQTKILKEFVYALLFRRIHFEIPFSFFYPIQRFLGYLISRFLAIDYKKNGNLYDGAYKEYFYSFYYNKMTTSSFNDYFFKSLGNSSECENLLEVSNNLSSFFHILTPSEILMTIQPIIHLASCFCQFHIGIFLFIFIL